VQVGLLIGKLGLGSRDFLLFLVKTPDQDDTPAVRQTSKAAAGGVKKGAQSARTPSAAEVQLQIDTDWLEEHASQVARMLPGGNHTSLTRTTVVRRAKAASVERVGGEGVYPCRACAGLGVVGLYLVAPESSFQPATPQLLQMLKGLSDAGDALVLLADSVSGKCSAKEWSAAASALRPADLKFSALLGFFAAVRCRCAAAARRVECV
jgi:Odorant response abnormal 4-like